MACRESAVYTELSLMSHVRPFNYEPRLPQLTQLRGRGQELLGKFTQSRNGEIIQFVFSTALLYEIEYLK